MAGAHHLLPVGQNLNAHITTSHFTYIVCIMEWGIVTIDIIIIIGAPLIPDMPIDFVLLELLQHSQQKTHR